MEKRFFERPILNSPYKQPVQHWELDEQGQPTQVILACRREAKFISPIPKPRKQQRKPKQGSLILGVEGISSDDQQYEPTPVINELRAQVDSWRKLPNPSDWGVTPETARPLTYWRTHPFSGIRPLFCQIEAVETAIYLTEVAPNRAAAKRFLEHLANSNKEANPELMRLALKLATGAGKTTVVAMLIVWQTINAARKPGSSKFTRAFPIVAPGLTIKDRLQVLQPKDPYSYYKDRELVPRDMLCDLQRAEIGITNYQASKARLALRGRSPVAPRPRSGLQFERTIQL